MRLNKTLLLFCAGMFACFSAAAQQTVYISDELYVPLRSGHGVEYRIINAAMKSGTRLSRLEVSDDGKWSKVRTASGTEGWIRNQYLVENMTAQLRLNQAQSRLTQVEQENKTLKTQNQELQTQNNSLSTQASSESKSRSQMANELERIKQLSAGAIDLEQRYQKLLQDHDLIKTQRDSLLAENESLKNEQKLSFFLYGAGVLILGMILSIILPVLKPKKRYSEWT